MNKITLLFATVLFAVVGCKSTKTPDKNLDESFEHYKNSFISQLWKTYPGWASGAGFHDYDSVLVVPNAEARALELQFLSSQLDSLKSYPIDQLSDNNKTDLYLIDNMLQSGKWSINEFKSFEWNPSEYNVCGSFSELLNGTHDSLDNKLRMINLKLVNVPAYYKAAKGNIQNPTVEHTQLAIDQNLGGNSVFTSELPEAINKSGLSASEKETMLNRAKLAALAVTDYATFLKSYKNENPRSFRLGKELYAKKFQFDIQSRFTAEEIYQKAVEHKADLHQKMIAISNGIWEKHMGTQPKPSDSLAMVRQLIDKLSIKHVAADSFQTAIEQQIPELEKFVNAKKLLYLDPSKPLVVRREPDYMAGVAGASISAPGPYDKNGNTYYNVGSLTGWSPERAESYLREYNHYILQILNIHEAIPGHYTQLVYSNQSPSLIKSILGNGAMIEGWAVYTERMMLENGYGNNEPEMWLMYYKWNLRTTCNTILDYGVHNNNMSKVAAMDLLVNQAFQQQAEAEGKWKRVSLSQVQLCSYFTGYKEIYDFRDEWMKLKGDSFNLKGFHEQFLSYGSAPVKYIKELMLNSAN